MKKVITYGTFDTFHYGHFFLLERAKKLGSHLTVCVSTDKFNIQKKGQIPKLKFSERCRIISSLNFVDYVCAEECWEQKIQDIKRLDISIFAIGEDWKDKFDFLKIHCDVVHLSRTNDVSSSLIRGY